MIEPFDILGLGCVAVDDLLYVDAYPPADAKTRVQGRQRQCGGLTATALVAAARLGAKCAYGGTLGEDESQNSQSSVCSRNTSRWATCGGARMRGRSAGDHRRPELADLTIFYDLDGVEPVAADWPPEELIRAARVLFVDHFGVAGMLRAARLALAAGIPVVADFECFPDSPEFAELRRQWTIRSCLWTSRGSGRVVPRPDAAAWPCGRRSGRRSSSPWRRTAAGWSAASP